MSRVPVEIVPHALRDGLPQRCAKGTIRSAVSYAVQRLIDDDLEGAVRPWDLAALRRSAAGLGNVRAVRVISVEADTLVAELRPEGRRILFRGVDDGWRLVRFAEGEDTLGPETTRTVTLTGWGPDAVLAALGIDKPEKVTLEYTSEDLGQGETRTCHRYAWTDGARSVVAEEVKNEIYDGATPYTTFVRGVVVEGDRRTLLYGSGDKATIVEG